MTKKKTQQPYSQYAIIDLPIEVCIQRILDKFDANPLADIQFIHDDRVQIRYDLSTPEQTDIEASATITRWQGTQTRVLLHAFDEKIVREGTDVFGAIFLVWLLFVFLYGVFSDIPITQQPVVIIIPILLSIAVIIKNPLQSKIMMVNSHNKRVLRVWSTLLMSLATDESGATKYLVEQGDAKDFEYEDYLMPDKSGEQST